MRSGGAIRAQDTPVVVLDRRAEEAGVDGVRCDSEGGAYALGKLLLSLGHRSLAMLAGPAGVSTADDRVAGWRRAMAEAGLAETCPIYRGDLTQPSGSGLTLRAMGGVPHPTAIFAANNLLAIGALNALRQGGRQVPEEVALVGFDDLPTALLTDPFLTVATQPAHAMGRRAVELLLDRLHGRAPDEPRQVVLPTEVVVRRSSGGPLRAQSTVGGGFPVVRPPRT
ncbi:MAG: substrate-binding domain-containing protein [Armatimonadetes bacterium]|nr:substrate-binding domain-containing protein [Armatimonadota bacterium]